MNWRTATAYDATRAIAEGLLRAGNNRSALQQTLAAPDFAATSAGQGAVRFLDTGDRRLTPVLVQVQQDGANRYRFRHLPADN